MVNRITRTEQGLLGLRWNRWTPNRIHDPGGRRYPRAEVIRHRRLEGCACIVRAHPEAAIRGNCIGAGVMPVVSSCSIRRCRVPRPCAFCKGGYDAADTTFVLLHERRWYAFVVPALCKLRKGRGTLFLVCPNEVKSPGQPFLICVFLPVRSSGCPSLRFLQGGYGAACTMCFVVPSGLHRTYAPHHLHFITCSCYHACRFFDTARCRDRSSRSWNRAADVIDSSSGYVSCRSTSTCSSPNRRWEHPPP